MLNSVNKWKFSLFHLESKLLHSCSKSAETTDSFSSMLEELQCNRIPIGCPLSYSYSKFMAVTTDSFSSTLEEIQCRRIPICYPWIYGYFQLVVATDSISSTVDELPKADWNTLGYLISYYTAMPTLPNKVKMQNMHCKSIASDFLFPWRNPTEMNRRSILSHNWRQFLLYKRYVSTTF